MNFGSLARAAGLAIVSPVSKVTTRLAFAAALGVALIGTSASAATVVYAGTTYKVSVIEGSIDDNLALMQSQIWWGDASINGVFVRAVGGDLGYPNDFATENKGPFFAYSYFKSYTDEVRAGMFSSSTNSYNYTILPTSKVLTYAVATEVPAVPLPAGGLLLLSGLAGVAGLRRLKKIDA